MRRSIILVYLYIAATLPAITLQTAFEHEWSLIQRYDERGDKSLKRKDRFWNDDLEPCIMKYCLRHQMQTLRYMKCIRRHCPSGLVTVPRDLDVEMQDMINNPDSNSDLWQQPSRLLKTMVNQVCAKLFCGYMKSRTARKSCILATCLKGKNPDVMIGASTEGKMSAQDILKTFASHIYVPGKTNVITEDNHAEQMNDKSRDLVRFGTLKRKIKVAKLCGIVLCPGLEGIAFLSCVSKRCSGTKSGETNVTASGGIRRNLSLKRAGREAVVGNDGRLVNDVMDPSERTLVTKRLMNGDITWCIDSYCGRQSSRTARTACIVRTCNRMG